MTEIDYCPLSGSAARERRIPTWLPVRARKALRLMGVSCVDPRSVREALPRLAVSKRVGPSTMAAVRRWLDYYGG